MSRIRPTLTALVFAVSALVGSNAQAQVLVIPPTASPHNYMIVPYTYAQRPLASGRNSVLPSFSQRGGIGTTPFLGNRYGLGAYSRNYGMPRPQRVRRWRIR